MAPFYEPAWAYGGMARAASGLCRALARRGCEVVVVTALLDASHPLQENAGGVEVRRFPGPALLRRSLLPWARGLAAFLRGELRGCTIAHIHGHRSGLAWTARRALRAAGVRYVLQPHGTFPDHQQRRVAKRLFDRCAGDRIVDDAAALIALSEAEARDLPGPSRVIANGVEPPAPTLGGGASNARRVLFVGSDRFSRKRADVLPRLLEALPNTQLHLVGSYDALLTSLRHLDSRVQRSGVLSGQALADAYASADLLVHPAVGEAFGLVPFEAALCGTAGVVAGGHGCGEWYGRAGGCVVPPDDFAALVAAVRARLSNAELGCAEADAVAHFTRRELTWERAAEQTEGLYRELAPA